MLSQGRCRARHLRLRRATQRQRRHACHGTQTDTVDTEQYHLQIKIHSVTDAGTFEKSETDSVLESINPSRGPQPAVGAQKKLATSHVNPAVEAGLRAAARRRTRCGREPRFA